jgi:hypothetical protein
VVAISHIVYDAYSFFLLDSETLKIGRVGTTINIDTVSEVRMDHGIVQFEKRIFVKKVFDSVYAEERFQNFYANVRDMGIRVQRI